MSSTTFEKYSVRARAIFEVGAHLGVAQRIEMPIDSIQCTHEENSIPFCVISVGMGRLATAARSPGGVSPIHFQLENLRFPAYVIVQLLITPKASTNQAFTQRWPNGWFTVFDGRVTNVNPSMNPSNATLSIQITHWLCDLDFSSLYSEETSPATPADFLFNAATVAANAGQRQLLGPTMVTKALAHFSNATALFDFWDSDGSGLRPFLSAVASERVFNWAQVLQAVNRAGEPPRTNSLLQRALSRFEPTIDDFGFSDYIYGSPLTLRGDLTESAFISSTMRSVVSSGLYDGFFLGATMWDRLVNAYANRFMFSIIPMVDRALIVPYTPWMRRFWILIPPQDYDVVEYVNPVRRPVRAVTVAASYGCQTGANPGNKAGARVGGNGRGLGYFEPPSPNLAVRDGMTLVVEPPAWINNKYCLSGPPAPPDGRMAVAQNPGGANQGKVNEANQQAQQRKLATTALANTLARATYLQEVTRWRQIVISTKLRFDIAPGSSILLEGVTDKVMDQVLFGTNDSADDLTSYARAVRITWSLQLGQQPSGSTQIHLAYGRTVNENNDDAFSWDQHPLWKTQWTGAPLVGRPEFDPRTL